MTAPEVLVRHAANLERLSELWNARSTVEFRSVGSSLLGPDYRGTQRRLQGRLPFLRNWPTIRYGMGQIRSVYSPAVHRETAASMRLPTDSILFDKWNGDLLIAASASRDQVAKLAAPGLQSQNLKTQASRRETFQGTCLDAHIPRLTHFECEANDGQALMLAELVPDFGRWFISKPERRLTNFLEKQYTPAVLQFYGETSHEILSLQEWLTRLKERAAQFPENTELNQIVRQYRAVVEQDSNHDAVFMPVGMVHGDLKLDNLRTAGPQWWLIDWTAPKPMGLVFDFVASYFYEIYRGVVSESALTFWKWLLDGSDQHPIPTKLMACYSAWRKCYQRLAELFQEDTRQLERFCGRRFWN